MIVFILQALELLVFAYFAASTVYLLVLAIAGRAGVKAVPGNLRSTVVNRIAVLIPAYREDRIIYATAASACGHDYDHSRYEVVVIEDQLQQATLEKLRTLPITVISTGHGISMKSKALLAGIHYLRVKNIDIVMILDADNIMLPGCLEKVNAAFQRGCQAVQCHRIAKNAASPIALLDAISEEININIFRRGPSNLGLSAAPMGSGMAFRYQQLAEILQGERILIEPGEDREIDMQLMKKGIRIQFIDDAFVLDEKVTSAKNFQTQRTRWLEAQFKNFRRFFDTDMRVEIKSAAYYHRFFQTLLLPRLLYLLLILVVALALTADAFTGKGVFIVHPTAWVSIIFLFLLSLVMSVPAKFYTFKTLQALLRIPMLMVSMLKAVFSMRKNRETFLHTPKNL